MRRNRPATVTRVPAWLAAAATAAIATTAAAADPPASATTTTTTATTATGRLRVAVSAEGGISLGAYEAGLNWALLNELRADGNVDLVAATGASAGNINALLTALSWCGLEPDDVAEESWFFRMWMDVGLATLFPSERDGYTAEDGVFTRAAYTLAKEKAQDALAHAPMRACNLPIGVTATRVEPAIVEIAHSGVTAAAQRYVVPLRVTSREEHRGLDVRYAPELATRVDDLGPVLVPPSDDDGVVPHEQLFRLVEVSSAFPVAFGPALLDYCELRGAPGPKGGAGAANARGVLCPPGFALAHNRFLDGGLFDNNPIGMTVRLPDAAPAASPPTTFLYLSTSLRRGWPASDGDVSKERGLGYLASVASGFWDVSRQYELQILAREEATRQKLRESLARDIGVEAADRVGPADVIVPTTRRAQIFGEHLGAFAAFAARSFREYDFYVGAYDGLYAAASVLCHRDGLDDDAADRCRLAHVRRALDRLRSTKEEEQIAPESEQWDLFGWRPLDVVTGEQQQQQLQQQQQQPQQEEEAAPAPSPPPAAAARKAKGADPLHYIARRLACAELGHAGGDDATWACDKHVTPARRIFRDYATAQEELGARWAGALRVGGNELTAFEARDPFLQLLDALGRSRARSHLRDQELKRADKDSERPWLRGEINDTISLIASPDERLLTIKFDLLQRAIEIEREDKNEQTTWALRTGAFGISSVESLAGWRAFGGPILLEMLPSSAPHVTWWSVLSRAAPSSLSANVLHGGADAKWRLGGLYVRFAPEWNLGLVASADVTVAAAGHPTSFDVSAPLGGDISLRQPWGLMSRLELGWRVTPHLLEGGGAFPRSPRITTGPSLSTTILYDKLRLGAMLLDVTRPGDFDSWMITVGFDDVPGILYWLPQWLIWEDRLGFGLPSP